MEKTLNCPVLENEKNDMAECQEDGNLLAEDFVHMEKVYHSYLANFLHNGDPNDGTDVTISNQFELVSEK